MDESINNALSVSPYILERLYMKKNHSNVKIDGNFFNDEFLDFIYQKKAPRVNNFELIRHNRYVNPLLFRRYKNDDNAKNVD